MRRRGLLGAAILGALGLVAAEPLCVSGVYPHLAMTNREGECGTGAVVPWAGSLWAVTYAPHAPVGSSDKLYQIKPDLTRVIRPESVGGTPAERLIHRETGKLLIGQYLVSSNGAVETVWISRLPGRLTGAARHLTEPAKKVYVTDMEEALYELDVTDPTKTFTFIRDGHNRKAFDAFFKKWNRMPPPGWNEAQESTLFGYHGKGTCSGFGKVFYANNGMSSAAAMKDPRTPSGCLAYWEPGDRNWTLIRTNQFTEITTRDGIYGNEHPNTNPIWALGWDHRSVILTTTADGKTWHDYRLPKASHSYDGAHGWNTEWPRIREIGTGDDFLATMHGTFWKFPADFAPGHAQGLRPRSTYLKVIGDFCRWNDRVVFGCDDHAKSEFLNVRALKGKRPTARPSESNLWFVEPARLDDLGPREGRGAVWSGDAVVAGQASDPFLFAGYDRRWLWLTVAAEVQVDREGHGEWTTWKTLAPGGYDLGPAPDAEWVRLVAKDQATNVFAVFHYASDRRDRLPRRQDAVFQMSAPAEAATIFENDAPIPQGLILEDAASLIYVDHGVRRRLPRRAAGVAATCGRLCREVSTERDLLHVGEIFYELPADNAGGFKYVHPVAATPRQFCDYDTWKGCLVLKEKGMGKREELKVGVADDLWRLGKPVGVGGPWKKTAVEANVPSDAYLMNGFDRKTVILKADVDTTVTLEADIDGCGTWVKAASYSVKANQDVRDDLSPAFAAYWVRARVDRACTASVQFLYH